MMGESSGGSNNIVGAMYLQKNNKQLSSPVKVLKFQELHDYIVKGK